MEICNSPLLYAYIYESYLIFINQIKMKKYLNFLNKNLVCIEKDNNFASK